eukprot:gene45742-25578_t
MREYQPSTYSPPPDAAPRSVFLKCGTWNLMPALEERGQRGRAPAHAPAGVPCRRAA